MDYDYCNLLSPRIDGKNDPLVRFVVGSNFSIQYEVKDSC